MKLIWKGRAQFGDESYTITLRQLDEESVKGTAVVYRNSLIDKRNYKLRLNPESQFSFEKCGGMFTIHDENSLRELMGSNQSDLMVVAETADGEICAVVWVADNDPHFKDFDKRFVCCEGEELLEQARNAQFGKVFYGREIIVADNAGFRGVAVCMVYCVMKLLDSFGVEYLFGEVYDMKGYEDGDGLHETPMGNIRSFKVMQGCDGTHIGRFKAVKRFYEGFAPIYESDVFLWRIADSLKRMEDKISQKGYSITWMD